MLGYRSIGREELDMLLLARNPIYGKRCWATAEWIEVKNPPNYGIVCFFEENYKWHDKEHKFDIIVDLKDPIHGHGVYMASKNLTNTKIWTGRYGKTKHRIPELYVRSYCLEDVKSINCNGYFNNSHSEYLENICKAYDIEFTR